MRILVNHVGYFTHGYKKFLVEGPRRDTFQLVERDHFQPVYEGKLVRASGGDLGDAWIGDFTDFQQEGSYYIDCPGYVFEYPTRSDIVVISNQIYDMPIRTIFNYYPTQRCGDSDESWCGPCHLDDAVHASTGEQLNLTGGWHQSCDLRKWVSSSSWAFYGIHEINEYQPIKRWLKDKAYDEVRWGNQYFQSLIKPDGSLYDSIFYPNDFVQRKVYDGHPPYYGVCNVINAQCMSARMFAEKDPEYSVHCLELAERVWGYYNTSEQAPKTAYNPSFIPKYHDFLPRWTAQNYDGSALRYGDRLYCDIELYKTTGKELYLQDARACAKSLCALQDLSGGVGDGSFFRDGNRAERISTTDDGALGPLGLLELIRIDREVSGCYLENVKRYAEHLMRMAGRNPWGLIACYLYTSPVPGSRQMGELYYRYFADDYEFGVNKEILGRGLFLLELSLETGESRYEVEATRIVDFILGVNMFNTSTVEGVGRNQPQYLINTTEFNPKTPQIPGAVMTGLAGYQTTDEPFDHTTCAHEYDMPATSFMLMLLIRLQQLENKRSGR